ncbi:LacI family DNA-binding transcriptional regulator, partial [Streptomyces mirabilis]
MTRRLAQVAKKVGVSEATVSRVLNGKPGVSDSTRQAVLSALDVLGYERPTQLRGERARLVGLVLPELQNPIFPAFAEVIGGALAQLGLTPVLCTQTKGGVSEADYVELLLQQQVSGVVFAGGLYAQADAPHEHYRQLADRNIPVVLVNAAIEHLGFPCVSCDDAVAVEQAWRHLVSLGHERIGLVLGPADHMPSARKLA